MHFVIHSAYGSRINRAWGLALRKRFCRRFNFELQAAASDDSIVLSLGPTHSFPLEEPAQYLKAATVKDILIQALIAAPMFPTRWRWVANTALAVPRNRAGKKVPAYFQRNDAEDLIAVIFPDQLACQENITGNREIPDHPLVNQTLADCLHELMDIDGLERLLTGIEQGTITIIARDLASPSPLALEILNARPYAFLDDAPAEERRTLAVQQRRFMDPQSAADIGRLNPEAIERVRIEAWPEAHTPDELHDALVVLGFLTETEGERGPRSALHDALAHGWPTLMESLQQSQTRNRDDPCQRHASMDCRRTPGGDATAISEAPMHPCIEPLSRMKQAIRIARYGKSSAAAWKVWARLPQPNWQPRWQWLPPPLTAPWPHCNRKASSFRESLRWKATQLNGVNAVYLARIHRYTIKQLRTEIEPVAPADFMRFLFRWHGLDDPGEGEAALQQRLLQLEGLCLPSISWEADILSARMHFYQSSDLDKLCSSGKIIWLRLQPPAGNVLEQTQKPCRKIHLNQLYQPGQSCHIGVPLHHYRQWKHSTLSGNGAKVYAALKQWGASFFEDLLAETGLLKSQLEEALGNWPPGDWLRLTVFRACAH